MPCVSENTAVMSEREMKFDGENGDFESGCFSPSIPVEMGRKIAELRNLLLNDPRAADLKWSLFVAAAHTYRYNTCLKPFPPMFIKNKIEDIEALRQTIEVMPPFSVMISKFDKIDVHEEYGTIIDLMHWALIRLKDPSLKSLSKDNFNSVLSKTPSEMKVSSPTFIFQVSSAKQSSSEEKWESLSKGKTTFFAYHGSKVENFHSILHYGLQQHLSRNALFGDGVYFSSELGVSMTFSPIGYSWGASLLGSQLSCVALCELVDHPRVKRGDSNDERGIVRGSVGGKIPHKYFVVHDNDLVRIRYLLVYSQDFGIPKQMKSTGVLSWLKQHKLLAFILGYVILLASVGLSHNKDVEKYYRLLIQKVGLK